MIVALIDNGSLEPAALRNLRRVAAELSRRAGVEVHPVSWKHSDRIDLNAADNLPAATLAAWIRAQVEAGERDFIFVPFFVSAQGAIGSALHRDLHTLAAEVGGFRFTFTASLAANGALARIVAARIRDVVVRVGLRRPSVVVVDHGGPATASAILRNQVGHDVRRELGALVGALVCASMEGAEYAHNRPLLCDALASGGFDRGEVVIAPLFLSPGRHAGPSGDLAQIARAAEDRVAVAPLRCHFTELVGTHPLVVPSLADALTQTLSTLSAAA